MKHATMADSCVNLPSFQSGSFLSFINCYQSGDTSLEESIPSRRHPKPSQNSRHESLTTMLDPSLLVTPERRPPTVVQLRNTSPSPVAAEDSFCSRATRVHFDQLVSVHHISPESASSSLACDASTCRDDTSNFVCDELDLTNLSDSDPISIVASDLRKLSLPPTDGSLRDSYNGLSNSVRNLASKLSHNKSAADIAKRNSTCSPDLDRVDLKSRHGRQSPSDHVVCRDVCDDVLQRFPLVVSETGSTDGLSLSEAFKLTVPSSAADSQCILARPELNSTLRMNREMKQIKEQEFDLSAVIKEKINPKLKSKCVEKAYSKLNADTNMYPDLIGLEVSETDLLSRLADEQLSRAKACDVVEKDKAEDKISRVPDVMDFFTSDLHKESASVSMVGVSVSRHEPHTAELHRAFDLYRHMRTWEKL